jgi:hypothetical protein
MRKPKIIATLAIVSIALFAIHGHYTNKQPPTLLHFGGPWISFDYPDRLQLESSANDGGMSETVMDGHEVLVYMGIGSYSSEAELLTGKYFLYDNWTEISRNQEFIHGAKAYVFAYQEPTTGKIGYTYTLLAPVSDPNQRYGVSAHYTSGPHQAEAEKIVRSILFLPEDPQRISSDSSSSMP